MLEAVTQEWGGRQDLWIFGYASLIWRPEFEFSEERFATIYGYHRALKMWSRVNRGTPECPGLVFGLLHGVYDPKWLVCQTGQGPVRALAFTLSKRSPNHTGVLSEDAYRQIFSDACGRYGTTRDYAQLTFDKLRALGIHDHALGKLLQLAS